MRIVFVVGSFELFPSTAVRVREYYAPLRQRGFEPVEVPYTSVVRERMHARWITGARRIRPRLLRELARGALYLWRRAAEAWCMWRVMRELPQADAVFIQWVLPPASFVRRLRNRGTRVIYDFDDAVFLPHPKRARAMVTNAWRVCAGSHFNLDYALGLNAASALVPSSVPVERYNPARERRAASKSVRIGWIGSPWTLPYLASLTGSLRALADRGLPVSLLIVGAGTRTDLIPDYGKLPVELVPDYSGADLPGLVARMDVGLMPLHDGPWERGKCAMKALVYMAGGCPAVCSPVGETNFVIEDRRTGFLARTPEEWEAVLAELAVDDTLRTEVGARGREVVVERYSTKVCFEMLYAHALAPLAAEAARRAGVRARCHPA